MTLLTAISFDNIQLDAPADLTALGFDASGINTSVSQANVSKVRTLNGRLVKDVYGTAGYCLLDISLPLLDNVSTVVIGWRRIMNTILNEDTTGIVVFQPYNTAYPANSANGEVGNIANFNLSTSPATESYLEVEIDVANLGVAGSNNMRFYRDGILVSQTTITTAAMTTFMKTNKNLRFGLVIGYYNIKSFTGATDPLQPGIKDIYVLQKDSVYPNVRLGPINVKGVPLIIDSVVDMDKTAAQLAPIAAQKLKNTSATPGALDKSAGVAQSVSFNPEINFRLDLSSVPVERRLATSIQMAVNRRGTIVSNLEYSRYLDGAQVDKQTTIPWPVSNIDRAIVASKPMAAGASMGARDPADFTYKLKLNA